MKKTTDCQRIATEVVRELQGRGYEAYFVGGGVRDMIRGETPTDIDVATNATPDEVESIFRPSKLVGAHFGVVVVVQDGVQVEVATFRADGDYLDGRRPEEVTFTDAEGDVRRRDFTINALLYDPIADKLIDLVGGKADIEARLIRAIGEPRDRFAEDHLRLLRAVRFAARLRFDIEPETARAIRDLAEKIKIVSAERIGEEMRKILVAKGRDRGIRLMEELGLLLHVVPEVSDMVGVEQPPNLHPEGDLFEHVLLMLSYLKDPSPELAWGVLLHDIGKPRTIEYADRIRYPGHEAVGADLAAGVCRRLKMSNESRDAIVYLVRRHMCFKDVENMRLSTLKRLLGHPEFPELIELHRVDALASGGDLTHYKFCVQKREELGEERMKPAPLITGHDLIKLGLEPGPAFSKILSTIQDEQLDEKLTSREDALARAKELAGLKRSE
ncbi:MAG: CCA tRNA nucleotidyltransferase [Planctomycetes bacterium]|nr:CCA tRNA nucleotidyltransferase [Planctomycetota bacterium]